MGEPINPKELQQRMGHSSITMTLDRYGHLPDKSEDTVVEAMASAFTPAAGAGPAALASAVYSTPNGGGNTVPMVRRGDPRSGEEVQTLRRVPG